MIHNHEVPSSILGRATREPHCKKQWGFLFCSDSSLLEGGIKTNNPRGRSTRGSLLLGCIADHSRITEQSDVILALGCIADRSRITERREVILPAKLQMTQNHHIFFVILYKQNWRIEIWRERTEKT